MCKPLVDGTGIGFLFRVTPDALYKLSSQFGIWVDVENVTNGNVVTQLPASKIDLTKDYFDGAAELGVVFVPANNDATASFRVSVGVCRSDQCFPTTVVLAAKSMPDCLAG